MIKIESLRKEFDKGVVALDDISLTVEDSSFVALLGPSGCGKTTTLNCIAGLLEPTAGKVFFGEKDVTGLAPRDRNIGMVFQSYALYPHMKVIDNIAFSLKQKGMPKAERHEKARQMAKKLQIEHLLDRLPGELSGGQQQRVSMARALVKEPDVLLLDEPMSNLDARLKIEIRDEIRRIQQELGLTSIIVTHDQEEAMAIADKIAILDNGRIQQYDTPQMLYHHPVNLFVAHFMGNPPMNFADASVMKKNGSLYLSGNGFMIPVPDTMAGLVKDMEGRDVVIGVRSHQMDVFLTPSEDAIEMKLSIVENLGKEIMISGKAGGAGFRVTVPETFEGSYEELSELRKKNGSVYLKLHEDYCIFNKENGENLSRPEQSWKAQKQK